LIDDCKSCIRSATKSQRREEMIMSLIKNDIQEII